MNRFFPDLARFSSTKELLASPLYASLRPEIERVLGSVVQEDMPTGASGYPERGSIRVTSWNIERGARQQGIIEVLRTHSVLHESDILLLTELDCGMARTGNRFVAQELTAALGMGYVFAPCYLVLTKGSGFEARAAGENTLSLHGNALLSRYPLARAHSLALPNGKDKMRGEEKRLGSQRAVIADVVHPLGTVRMVSLHLDAHSSQRHRRRQMELVLDHLETLRPQLPVLIGGDWNTSTYDSRRAVYSIAGYCRRVLMGVDHVVRNHYPHPDRWFERGLFRELERRGFNYRDLNEPGACTLHYDVSNAAVRENMSDWVPQWCFWFIDRALKRHEGRCSMKLDWFAGRGIAVAGDAGPRVIRGLADDEGPLSDHDAIVVDVIPADLRSIS